MARRFVRRQIEGRSELMKFALSGFGIMLAVCVIAWVVNVMLDILASVLALSSP